MFAHGGIGAIKRYPTQQIIHPTSSRKQQSYVLNEWSLEKSGLFSCPRRTDVRTVKAGDITPSDLGKQIRFICRDQLGPQISGTLVDIRHEQYVRGNQPKTGVTLTINVGVDRRGHKLHNVTDDFGPLNLAHPITFLESPPREYPNSYIGDVTTRRKR